MSLEIRGLLRAVAYRLPVTRTLAQTRARRLHEHQIMKRADLLAFWQQPEPVGNVPEDFIDPVDRSRVLALLLEHLPREARVLEVGCNVGRNLAYLADAGYTDLEGVEISKRAVDLLRNTYPKLADTPIHLGAAEDVLPGLDGPYDLVFTMAVLEHIHPKSQIVFDEICRLACSVLAIEPAPGRVHASIRTYPHDLKRAFEQRGLKLVSIDLLREERWQPNDLPAYAAWRFERPAASAPSLG